MMLLFFLKANSKLTFEFPLPFTLAEGLKQINADVAMKVSDRTSLISAKTKKLTLAENQFSK